MSAGLTPSPPPPTPLSWTLSSLPRMSTFQDRIIKNTWIGNIYILIYMYAFTIIWYLNAWRVYTCNPDLYNIYMYSYNSHTIIVLKFVKNHTKGTFNETCYRDLTLLWIFSSSDICVALLLSSKCTLWCCCSNIFQFYQR